jgi:hypothetical protein
MRALGLHVMSCYQYGKPGWVNSPSDFTRVIGASSSPGFRWAWQTRAWSGGKRVPGAVLFQREVVTAGDPGALIDGVSVDVDDVLAPDFGQWDLPR